MQSYELSPDAENDLREVARYTLNKWGKDMYARYRDGLDKTFTAIGKHEIKKKTFLKHVPDLFVTKYRYHYIFYLSEDNKKPVIIGVIHERRDAVSRLSERLF